jgi:glycosyltransferase involved in cell wall biosynthesis
MKKITFIIGIMGNGGAERVISVLSNNFIDHDYKVNIITIYGNRTDYNIDKRIDVFNIECKDNRKICRYIERIKKIRKLIKEINPDIIISFLADVNIFVLIATLFLKNKIIISERNDPNSDPKSKLVRILRDKLYFISDGYVFQTDDARDYFSYKIKNKGAVIPNPIENDLPHYNYIGTRKEEVVSVCRLCEQKNIKMAIDAFYIFSKTCPTYTYTIYGDGPLKSELQNYIKTIGLSHKVKLAGFEKNIHEKIISSKMLIISSKYEGISNIMLESMAIGLPVISTDCPIGGARKVIQNYQNGVLIPVENTKQLAIEMVKLATDDSLYHTISANAIQVKNDYSANTISEKWIKYINKIIGVCNAKKFDNI